MPDAHSALAAPGSEDSPQNGRGLGNLHFAYRQSVVYAAAATGVMPRSWKRVRIWMRGSRSRGPPGSRRRACVPCGAAGAGEHRADDLVAEREQGGEGAGSAGRDAVAAGLAGLDSKALPAELAQVVSGVPDRAAGLPGHGAEQIAIPLGKVIGHLPTVRISRTPPQPIRLPQPDCARQPACPAGVTPSGAAVLGAALHPGECPWCRVAPWRVSLVPRCTLASRPLPYTVSAHVLRLGTRNRVRT